MNYSEQEYGDILNMPHHVSASRPQMPMSDRAAQFSPFAALTGYDAAIKETGRLTDTKIELDDEELHSLNLKFQFLVEHLEDEPEVAVTYFKADERKAGGAYLEATGIVKKLDDFVSRRTLAVKGLNNQYQMRACYDKAAQFYKKPVRKTGKTKK